MYELHLNKHRTMKKILVPTDFSEHAMSALKVASNLARKTKAEIDLVHVYEIPLAGFSSSRHIGYDQHELKRMMDEFHNELKEIAGTDVVKGITVRTHLIPNIDFTEILEQKALEDADLIVCGTHGTNGWKEEMIGSNTEKLIRKSSCPVLTVRKESGNQETFPEVVFASSFYGETFTIFPKLKSIVDLLGGRFNLLSVNTASQFQTTHYAEKLMKEFAEKQGLKNYTTNIYNDESREDGVINFCNRINADLIVMETHGRTGLAHLLTGSVTEDVANHSNRPLLSMKIERPAVSYGSIFPESR